MNHPYFFLAEIDPDQVTALQQQYLRSPFLKEVLIVAGALTAAVLISVVGAYLYWKKSQRRRHRSGSSIILKNAKTDGSDSREGSRGRKRRRRSSRPMYSTLAETGGLPPARSSSETSPNF